MGEASKTESQMTSASAFVEGGIQEACEDSCSICLEAFCESDPSTVTSCKHEFHLQCILEWCQRSSNCPMCWQSIRLKDPSSQELLEAVERERNFRLKPARNSTIFRHPALGDFELQHLPVNANDSGLEDHILQHLAAAAAMGRAQRVTRRDWSRIRSSADARRQFLLFSTHPSSPSAESVSASVAAVHGEHELASIAVPSPSVTVMADGDDPPQHIPQFLSVRSGQTYASPSIVMPNRERLSVGNRNFANQTSLPNPDRAGPSDFHSLSDSWKSRLNAMSTKYKDSISKSTRVWKEKLFSRSTSMADIGCEVRREVNAGITTVSQMMERLETRATHRDCISLSENPAVPSATEQSSHSNVDTRQQIP